jgi:YggT family protein
VTGTAIADVVCWVLLIAQFVLIIHVIFSWVPRPPEPLMPFVLGIRRLVEPLAAPIRKVLPQPQIGMVRLDLSIIVLFFGLFIIRGIVCR